MVWILFLSSQLKKKEKKGIKRECYIMKVIFFTTDWVDLLSQAHSVIIVWALLLQQSLPDVKFRITLLKVLMTTVKLIRSNEVVLEPFTKHHWYIYSTIVKLRMTWLKNLHLLCLWSVPIFSSLFT